jgi:hypothetical protein
MSDPTSPGVPGFSSSPSAKEKNFVQKSVVALLDELAPEKVLKRGDRITVPVEQHRTPTGCVLQAARAAVSVSWFVDSGSDKSVLGELHVTVWRGIVARRGMSKSRENATLERELVLHPIERPSNDLVWRATDGTEYDTASLASRILAMLEEQMRADPAG